MRELVGQTCEACRVGSPPATEAEIAEYSEQIPEWAIVERDGIPTLERVFPFRNFAAALEFTNRVGELAEQQGHHPALLTEWGRVTVTWWTPQDPQPARERLRDGREDGPGLHTQGVIP